MTRPDASSLTPAALLLKIIPYFAITVLVITIVVQWSAFFSISNMLTQAHARERQWMDALERATAVIQECVDRSKP